MSISTLCSPSLPPTPVIFSHPSCPFFYPTHHPLSASFCPTRPSQTLPPPSPSSFTYERRKPASPSHPLALIPRFSLLLSLSPSIPEFHRFSTATKFAIDISEWHVYIEWPLARFARGWNARKEIGNLKREKGEGNRGKNLCYPVFG